MSSRDLEGWMWAEACEMLERAERLHRQFFQPAFSPRNRPLWEPPVDVYETSSEFLILIALPGLAPEQVSVVLDGDYLVIAGERRLPVGTGIEIRRLEIPYGRFERRIQVPAGRLEIGDRQFSNGCLAITLSKR